MFLLCTDFASFESAGWNVRSCHQVGSHRRTAPIPRYRYDLVRFLILFLMKPNFHIPQACSNLWYLHLPPAIQLSIRSPLNHSPPTKDPLGTPPRLFQRDLRRRYRQLRDARLGSRKEVRAEEGDKGKAERGRIRMG
jgi:hypothetical protein